MNVINGVLAAIGTWWCRSMHKGIINRCSATYECAKCGRLHENLMGRGHAAYPTQQPLPAQQAKRSRKRAIPIRKEA